MLLGALGAGSQVCSQLIAFAGSLGAHLVWRLLCIGAEPSDFSLGSAGSGLGVGGLLLGLLGGGLGVGCRLTDPITVGLGGLGTLPGLGADRLDFGFGGGRVGEGVYPVPQRGTQRSDPVSFGAQRPQ